MDDWYEDLERGVASVLPVGGESIGKVQSVGTALSGDVKCVGAEVDEDSPHAVRPTSLGDLVAVDDLLLGGKVGSGVSRSSKLVVEITVDSGAAEVAAPPEFAPGHRLRASPGSTRAAKYRSASGNVIMSQGEQIVPTHAEGGLVRDDVSDG